jgi:hypothetical protein
MESIRAGEIYEIGRDQGDWSFIDIGFASRSKSCGLLIGDGQPLETTFGRLKSMVGELALTAGPPLNLVIEAPLSVAFNQQGNPTGRSIEKRRNERPRYWYIAPGVSVLVAATYLMRHVVDSGPKREIRLFEGFVSFKPKGTTSSHARDVEWLRDTVWHIQERPNAVVTAEQLIMDVDDRVTSAFSVSGIDFGVPPVIVPDFYRENL